MVLSSLRVCRLWQVAYLVVMVGVLLFGAAGCKNMESPEPTLRDNEMAETVRKARTVKADPEKTKPKADDLDYWGDERARQIERNLATQKY